MKPPKFTHDCDACVFLGRFADDTKQHFQDEVIHPCDLYICKNSIIARYSSEGGDYVSSALPYAIHNKVLQEAIRRACERGILTFTIDLDKGKP